MKEIDRGDTVSICELLHTVSFISDRERLRTAWQRDEFHTSYAELLATIFDDLRLRDRASMPDGYLGTYRGLPSDLTRLADALDRFDEWWQHHGRGRADLEILASELWMPVMKSARNVVHNANGWRREHCSSSD